MLFEFSRSNYLHFSSKGRGTLRRELDDLNEKLEETGSNTAAQIALNTRREEELAKLKMELDESNITHESTLAMLRQKHNGSIAEMVECSRKYMQQNHNIFAGRTD